MSTAPELRPHQIRIATVNNWQTTLVATRTSTIEGYRTDYEGEAIGYCSPGQLIYEFVGCVEEVEETYAEIEHYEEEVETKLGPLSPLDSTWYDEEGREYKFVGLSPARAFCAVRRVGESELLWVDLNGHRIYGVPVRIVPQKYKRTSTRPMTKTRKVLKIVRPEVKS